MIAYIFGLTLRQIVRRRSTLLLVGLAAIPVVLAIIFQINPPDDDPERWTTRVLFVGLVHTAVLPLTALLFGTSAIGDEIEDGTIVYLITKPLQRWQILVPKLAGVWLATSALVLASTVASGVIALDGVTSIVVGYGVGAIVGSLAYSTVFILLSVVTSRALISGLVYIFIWEGAITGIFEGTRYLSIRHYTLGLSDWIADTPSSVYNAYVGGQTAIIMIAAVILIAGFVANRRLEALQLREPG